MGKIDKIVKIEIIPFPVLKINLKLLWKNVKHLVKEVFDQRAGSGINNSISCLDNSVSCFENQFGTPWWK